MIFLPAATPPNIHLNHFHDSMLDQFAAFSQSDGTDINYGIKVMWGCE